MSPFPTPGKIQKQGKSLYTFKKQTDVGSFYYSSCSCAFAMDSCQTASITAALNRNKPWDMISVKHSSQVDRRVSTENSVNY